MLRFMTLTEKIFSVKQQPISGWMSGRGVRNPRCPAAVKGTKAHDATVMI
jgi:hypothetical protein